MLTLMKMALVENKQYLCCSILAGDLKVIDEDKKAVQVTVLPMILYRNKARFIIFYFFGFTITDLLINLRNERQGWPRTEKNILGCPYVLYLYREKKGRFCPCFSGTF
jgi:hypothetical protein